MVDLLILGAGPYGLAVAALARNRGLDTMVLGQPLEFWKKNMPPGMLLRSGAKWHMDPLNERTLEAFGARSDTPITLEQFLEYAQWFREGYGLEPAPGRVVRLAREEGAFTAHLDDGQTIRAQGVVVAAGFGPFCNLDHPLAGRPGVVHTCHYNRFDEVQGQRVLIVGGRQSAFEWAALLAEAGAAEVHVVHRHATPRFEPSNWDWLEPLMEAAEAEPGWFANLSEEERRSIHQRFWEEGRLKLEPWLAPRLDRPEVHLWPEHEVVEWDGRTAVLRPRRTLEVDRVVLATGYRMDLGRLEYLEPLRPQLSVRDGFPALSPRFESSVPGLFFTSFASTRDFGPFFGFVRGCPATARILLG